LEHKIKEKEINIESVIKQKNLESQKDLKERLGAFKISDQKKSQEKIA